jgi:flagellar hook-associated protein 1 FlgK
VNQLVGRIANYNQIALQGNKSDAGLTAQMHAAVEQLSQYVDVTATFQSDGTVSLMMNGQTPLLLEKKRYQISAGLYQPQDPPPVYSNAPASVQVLGPDGSDITAATTGGQLGGLLNLRNNVVASHREFLPAGRLEPNGAAVCRSCEHDSDFRQYLGWRARRDRRAAVHL